MRTHPLAERIDTMKHRKFSPVAPVTKRGYSDWIHPNPHKYLMECCDCGLVHEVQFKALHATKARKDGSFRYRELPRPTYRVALRVRRAERYTARQRAKRKSTR